MNLRTYLLVGAGLVPPTYKRVGFATSFIVHRATEPAPGDPAMVGIRVLDGRGRTKLAEFTPAIGKPYRFKTRVAIDAASAVGTTFLVTFTDDDRVTIGS